MATKLNIVLGIAESQAKAGMKPVMSDNIIDSETIDVTQANKKGAIVSNNVDQVWLLTAIGGNVWVSFGKDPAAVVGDSIPLMAGVPYAFSATPGFKVGVISE